tara:strand:+ start:8779 stop:9228 length:450 start_codon:yes stop_codon:yes gene_type:complete
MENAQIEVQYYNPSSTKAPHNVKATDGKTYKFWPGSSADNVFNEQSVGKTYVVEYKEEPGKGNYGPSLMVDSAILHDEDIPYGNGANGSAQPSYQPSQPSNDKILNEIHALYLKCYQLVNTEPAFQEFSTEQKGTTATTYFINASRAKQ